MADSSGGGTNVIYFDENRNDDLLIKELSEIVKKYKIDIIHLHFGYLHRVLLFNHKRIGNVKIVLHDHMDYGVDVKMTKQYIRQLISSILYRLNNVVVISVMKKKDRGYWLLGKKSHYFIPNGLSLKRNIQKSMTRDECRQEIGIKADEYLCLFLGWDIKRKGVDIAVKSIIECNKKGKKIVLGIIGFGNEPSNEIYKKLENIIGISIKDKDYIRFLSSVEDMYAYHRAADAYLSASRKEAFSYGILESISQNVPVVVSDIEGTSWSWNYDKCFVFKNEDYIDCSNSIIKAIETRNNDSNYQKIIEEYGIEKWCQEVSEVYKKIL